MFTFLHYTSEKYGMRMRHAQFCSRCDPCLRLLIKQMTCIMYKFDDLKTEYLAIITIYTIV
jgi:hypothetical protein